MFILWSFLNLFFNILYFYFWLLANIMNWIDRASIYTCRFAALLFHILYPALSALQNKCHKTRKDKKKSNKKWVMAIDISAWRNPASGDFAWLYINRVINRSITHSKGDSCHIKWRDVEHRPSYVSLLRGRFPGGGCACLCACVKKVEEIAVCMWRARDSTEASCHRHITAAGWKTHLERSGIQSAAALTGLWQNM